MQWLLVMSINAINIDAKEVIISVTEPDWCECERIAREHGCEWWSIEKIDDDGLMTVDNLSVS